MFLIPIGTGKYIRVFPYITIGLILTNILVFLITNGVVNQQMRGLVEIRQRMSEIEKEYLGDFVINSFLMMTAEEIDGRDQQIFNGEIIPIESVDYEIWSGLYGELNARMDHFIYQKLGFVPAEFNFFTIFSAMFMHSGWIHLISNMAFLWLAGANLEGEMGWKRFLLLYMFWGVAAALFHYSLEPSNETPCIGASGAIAGLMGAFLICFYKTRIEFLFVMLLLVKIFTKKFRIAAYICLPLWFLDQLISSKIGPDVGVAFGAHIGGFVIGACTVIILQAADLLPRMDPESDKDDENFFKASEKMVARIDDKDAFIRTASLEDLPTLLAIVRVEPDNPDALLALARLQFRPETIEDAMVSYNRALDVALTCRNAKSISMIYTEMLSRNMIKSLTRENLIRLIYFIDKLQQYKDAAQLAILFIIKFPKDAERPKMLYKTYLLCRNHLNDQEQAKKAAFMLKNEYPHLIKASS